MGNLLTRELKRDFIHLSEHTDFKTALRATGDLLDTYAKAEKLRLERKQQKMREREQARQRAQGRQHNRQFEEADPGLMGSKYEGYGPPPRRQGRRNTRTERIPHPRQRRRTEDPMQEKHDRYAADGIMRRESQDANFMQPNGRKRNPHAYPYPEFGMHPEAEYFDTPSPHDYAGAGFRPQAPNMSRIADSFEDDMRPRGFRPPRAQRRRSSRRDPRIPDHYPRGSSAGAGRSHAGGSRSGRMPSFHGSNPESGGPEYMDGPRQRRGECRTPDEIDRT